MRALAERPRPQLPPGGGYEFFWLAGILILAVTLRLWGLGFKSLWLDEIMTVEKASMSYSDMMDQIKQHDAHPPFFQIVEWLWLRLGRGDAFSRAPSVIAGIVCVWLCFLIARRLFGRKAGVAAAAMAAVSYFGIFYSQEARLQSLMTALFLGQVCLLLAILERRGKAGWGLWVMYGLVGLASLYTYALCALTVGALGLLYLWLTWRRHRQFGRWLAVHAAIALFFLPWWILVLRPLTAKVEESVREVGRPTPSEFTGGIAAWTVGPAPQFTTGRRGAEIGIACLLAAAAAAWSRKNLRALKILGLLFFLPLLLYLILPMPRVHLYDPKHLMFAQPILLIALAGARLPFSIPGMKSRSSIVLLVALGFAALNVLGLRDYYRPGFEKENWRRLAADVSFRAEPNDLILFNPGYIGYAFDYYAKLPDVQPPIAKAGIEPLLQGSRIEANPSRIWLIEDQSAVSRPSPQALEALSGLGWYPKNDALYRGALGDLRWIELFQRSSR